MELCCKITATATAFALLLAPLQATAQETNQPATANMATTSIMSDFRNFEEMAHALEAHAKELMDDATAHPFVPNGGQTGYADYLENVEAFATASAALSVKIDTLGGPHDLRCIYRGMAADARLRLGLLHKAKNAGAAAIIFKAMRALFADARDVTPKDMSMFADHHDGAASSKP